MRLIPEFRAQAVEYQSLLIEYIRELNVRRLTVASVPQALTDILAWVRAFDKGEATLKDYVEVTIAASSACGDAYDALREQKRKRIVHAIRQFEGGDAWLAELSRRQLDPLTEIGRRVSLVKREIAA
jgi:hypothetical protein